MPDRFSVFEVSLKKRGRKWAWTVAPTDGAPIMLGSESSRSAASYKANCALFLLLLSAPFIAAQGGGLRNTRLGLIAALANGWLWLHEYGTCVKFTEVGAALLA